MRGFAICRGRPHVLLTVQHGIARVAVRKIPFVQNTFDARSQRWVTNDNSERVLHRGVLNKVKTLYIVVG